MRPGDMRVDDVHVGEVGEIQERPARCGTAGCSCPPQHIEARDVGFTGARDEGTIGPLLHRPLKDRPRQGARRVRRETSRRRRGERESQLVARNGAGGGEAADDDEELPAGKRAHTHLRVGAPSDRVGSIYRVGFPPANRNIPPRAPRATHACAGSIGSTTTAVP